MPKLFFGLPCRCIAFQRREALVYDIDRREFFSADEAAYKNAYGNPMSASDLAFMLDLPQPVIDLSLSQLVSKGSILKDGDLFRYDLRRELTTSELAEIEDLHHQFEEMRPLIDRAPARLDN